MKKSLLITYFFPPQIGGIENYYLNFCQNLSPHEIVVLAQDNAGAGQFDQVQKYKIYRTDFFGGWLPPRWWQLKNKIRKIIKEEGIEQIIFGHFHPFNILGNYFGLPYFIFVHGTDAVQIKNSRWQKIVFKKVYKNCQRVIANSHYIAQEVKDLVNAQGKIAVVYPGIDYSVFSRPSDKLEEKKKELGLEPSDLVILSMGRLIKQKNFQIIIKLIPDLLVDFPHLKYIIVGDGQDKDDLLRLIDGLSLKKNVQLIGPVANNAESKKTYYQLADLFVSVSNIAEGFGISYLEAQASGVPVIASKTGGSSESVLDGKTGILVDPGDLGQIREAIFSLLSNEEMRRFYSQAGKKRMEEEFDWQKQVNKIKQILK